MTKKKSKIKIIILALIGVVAIAAVGVYLYFNMNVMVVNGIDELENIDPNNTKPVRVNLDEEDIANMTDEERKKYKIPDDFGKHGE